MKNRTERKSTNEPQSQTIQNLVDLGILLLVLAVGTMLFESGKTLEVPAREIERTAETRLSSSVF